MSQDKKYQVFISSTYTDLIEAREKVTKLILDLYHLPVGMEMFSADDDDQWKIITDAIDVSDYYVLIVGHRYGSLTNKGISYTEKEFNYAKSKKIPIISFIRDRNVPVSNSDRENVLSSSEKLDKFINKAKTGKMCAFWKDISDLERQIAIALPKAFAKHKGIGWVRGDQTSNNVVEELAKLSEENRKLREKIKEYESKQNTREPNLTLSLTCELNNDLKFQLKYSKNLDLYRNRKPIIINELDDEIRKELTDEKIADFNERLTLITTENIQTYNDISKKIDLLENTRYPISLFLMNTGSQKANNIQIFVTFPDFLMVFEKNDTSAISKITDYLKKEKLKVIPAPNYDPVAQIIANKSHMNSTRRTMGQIYPSRSDYDLTSTSLRNLNNPNKTYTIDNNTIFINRVEMIHQANRGYEYDDYMIVPIRVGTGVIKINIICEEYPQEKNYEIPITITE